MDGTDLVHLMGYLQDQNMVPKGKKGTNFFFDYFGVKWKRQ